MTNKKHEMVKAEDTTPAQTQPEGRYVAPRYEVLESESGYEIRLEMPGVSKDTLDIQADRETLSVRGRREESFEGLQALYLERPRAEYYREFSMDDTVDWEKIRASARDGIVLIEVPKASHAKPRRIEVS